MLTREDKIQWKKKTRLLKRKKKSGKVIQKYEKENISSLNFKRATFFQKISILIRRCFN